MRVFAEGANGEFVAVFAPPGEKFPVEMEIRPPELEAAVSEALRQPVEVYEPVLIDDTIGEGVIELQPGQPGHAAAALRALPWAVQVEDLDATLPDEGEEDLDRVADDTGAGG